MLALARGLATDPAVLLLDELSMGLAPLIVEEIYSIVARIARTGVSLFVVEQFARTVLDVADLAAIMVHGRIVDVGNPAAIADRLSAAYLGDTPLRTVEQRHGRGSMELMDEKHDRIDEFKQEIAEMRIRPPEDSSERMWLIAGIVLRYSGSSPSSSAGGAHRVRVPAEQLPYVISEGCWVSG